MSEKMIERHTKWGIFIHWFNAVFWFFLLATGLGLIQNPDIQPLGAWWPDLMRSIFGGGAALLWTHITAGAIWAGVWIIYAVVGLVRFTLPFLKEMVTITMPRDFFWLIKKQFQMAFGYKVMGKLVAPLGWDAKIPDQEYYNVGQKLAAIPLVLGGLVLAVTGAIMAVSKFYLDPAQVPLVQWSIFIHFLAAGITFAVLLIHIYMSSISLEERPALFSMFTGRVPESYAKHHHRLWWEKVIQEEKTNQQGRSFP